MRTGIKTLIALFFISAAVLGTYKYMKDESETEIKECHEQTGHLEKQMAVLRDSLQAQKVIIDTLVRRQNMD